MVYIKDKESYIRRERMFSNYLTSQAEVYKFPPDEYTMKEILEMTELYERPRQNFISKEELSDKIK